MWILRMAAIQLLLALSILLIFSGCRGGGDQSNKEASSETPLESAVLDSNKQVYLVDTDYVHIAGHHAPEVKKILKELEARNFEKGTLAHQLLDYLKSGVQDFGEEFKFIDLQFKDRTAEFNPKLTHEISELAEIMKAFPKLRIKMMSYTDNVGGEKANEILSENRLKNIVQELVVQGIDETRIETKAYGQQFPVGSNSIHEGRLINNRIELMVLSK
ncbi:MAG: OmpA family protein [Saprospiraceae bacterium]|nr:OmpA family protein [Saprospiraceae bacterium]